MTPLLAVEDVHVSFTTRHGVVNALRGVSFAVDQGETLGIVGESGSGKSVTALAVMRLLDRAGRVTSGRIRFRGEDITAAGRSVMQPLRGAAMSMIFQNPRAALNPIRPIGDQIADVLRAHNDISRRQANSQALELLEAVRIRDARERLSAFPHELSGGMCQRVMIAMAIACEPSLLIADEPTTGLDVTTQQTVMELLTDIINRRSMGLILITHDLGLAARYCQRIAVMEQGLKVEEAPPENLFGAPQHAYTKRLVAASPTKHSRVYDLVGEPAPPPVERKLESRPLLQVSSLKKIFGQSAPAVADVSFTLSEGASLGLVGESGSGKSTISRMICRLIDQTEGTIRYEDTSISDITSNDFHRHPLRSNIQLVFQDAGESLNPRFSAFDSIADPLRNLLGITDSQELRRRARDIAERCGLPPELLDRFPHQLSGGQRARVGIARAIAPGPRLLVLDEPTAALDVSVQAVILHLLDRLRRETGLAFVFVSHDLNVVRMMCERTIVLQAGRIVEEGSSEDLFRQPKTEYTAALLAAIPHFEQRHGISRSVLGDCLLSAPMGPNWRVE
ncbi:MAG: ABC transporter ATP-binding protein [Acetobacteraceae bacterium]|nr:ABC transporter ATP-binding protein [Acetobacteraceae bacterium]